MAPRDSDGNDYAITFDRKQRMLTIRAYGFWDRPTLNAFSDDLLREMNTLDASGTRFVVLADATSFPVQSIAVSLGFMGIVNRIKPHLRVPTAVVTGGALVKLQALRVLVAQHIRIFGDHETALEWLAETRQDKS